MKRKVTGLILLLLTAALLILPTTTFAVDDCGGGALPRAEGLVTTPDLAGKFSTTGKCVQDSTTTFNPVTSELKNYQEIRSRYFNQAKTSSTLKKIAFTGPTREGGLNGCLDLDPDNNTDCFGNQDSNAPQLLVYIKGNLGFANGSLTGTKTALVFVEGDLNIGPNPGNQYIYGDAKSGLVLVVSGNVNIDPAITRIDAVIISDGKIKTAGEDCTAASSVETTSPLTINGSLISLSAGGQINLCRTLTTRNGSEAAEIIVQQPKYLVILRDLLSETQQRWAEITVESIDPFCNTKRTDADCEAWSTDPNTCNTGNSSRLCINTTYNGDESSYCIRNNYTEKQTLVNCDTDAGYSCIGGEKCLLNCTNTPSCSGSCTAINPNTCGTDNGTRACVWTTNPAASPDPTNCNQVAVPSSPTTRCTVDSCSTNYSCNASGTCVLQNCDSGISCSGTCTATAPNTCGSANGTQSGCTFTTYSSGGSCTPITAPNQICGIPNCSSGYTCSGNQCLRSSKNVFVTSQYYTGNLGGLTGADQKCQQLANTAGIGSTVGLTYKAWLSDFTGSSPSTRFTRSSVPYRLVGGTLVANNWSDLTDGSLAAPINKDETGITRENIVFTSTGTNGSYNSSYTCANWSVESVGNGGGGAAGATNALWTQGTGASCDFTQAGIYCFEQ